MGLDYAKAKRRQQQRQAEADARQRSDARRKALNMVAGPKKQPKPVRVGGHVLPPSNPGLEFELEHALQARERQVLQERGDG